MAQTIYQIHPAVTHRRSIAEKGQRKYYAGMGYREYDIRVPAAAGDEELRRRIAATSGLAKFDFQILKKSLDARKKDSIVWQFRVGVESVDIAAGLKPELPTLAPRLRKRDSHVVIAGSGPAGIFAADYLLRSGFRVTVLERGSRVEKRREAIASFEKGGAFVPENNYSFGEGGAGTFSDGKLSSRTKGINRERNYIFRTFIEAGGPPEIFYMTHPHLGSDRLFAMTGNLRSSLENLGCTFLFDTQARDLRIAEGRLRGLETDSGVIDADRVIFACGHSAFETFRMLMRRGVPFRPKNFAVGFRAEHRQETINLAQWGLPRIPGVKAAEYRLAAQTASGTGVYSFCMCPGGVVVPAAAYPGTNIVNGMSNYARDSPRANAAVVAGLSLESLLGKKIDAAEALDWLENLERSYYAFSGSYRAPAMTIGDFLRGTSGGRLPESSYPLGLAPADFRELLPPGIVAPLREGLADFCRKLRGYDSGLIAGLESKTSAPIQADRHPELLFSHYENLYIAGEGSGWSGGIVSSAADGLRIAQAICGDSPLDSGAIY